MVVIVTTTPVLSEQERKAMEFNNSVEDHFEFFRNVYSKACDYYLVQKTQNVYNRAKHSTPFLENSLNTVEGHLDGVVQYSGPIYENYLYPTADRLVGIYSKGVDSSKSTVENAKNAVVAGASLGLGLVMVAVNMGLVFGAAAVNMFLDGLTATKNAGANVFNKTISAEKFVEEQVYNAINQTNELAKNPVEKLNEHANNFLDVANVVFERLLNLEHVDDSESALSERVSNLATRIVKGIKVKGSNGQAHVQEPVQQQMSDLSD